MKKSKLFVVCVFFLTLLIQDVMAQLQRERVVENRPVELTFPTPKHINLHTTEPLSAGELYYSIMHAFGTVENGITDFWGLDQGANIRFSLEYGITDRFSVFAGRSSMDKVYDLGFRYLYLQQMTGSGSPVSAGVVLTAGLMTEDYSPFNVSYSFSERNQLSVSFPVSRKFNDQFSLLLVPMVAVFSYTNELLRIKEPLQTDEVFAGVGFGSRYKLDSRTSVTLQYVPSYRFENEAFNHNLALGMDFETGGHVFQIFVSTSRALNDAYLLAAPNGRIDDYAFRFGFNINRSFVIR
ncbi:DUF5777 family beta-barrel protein [Balneolaceae bacterium ANBcel3]|nr:DUF5777 family beta-barrel protein [Balneolaceae bacterium ANBcel3]